MADHGTGVNFRPAIITEAQRVAAVSSSQVVVGADQLAGGVPGTLHGVRTWRTAEALEQVSLAFADHARLLQAHTNSQLDAVTDALNATLSADDQIAHVYATGVLA